MPPRRFTRNPTRFSGRSSQAPVQTHSAFGNDEWTPGHDPFAESFIQFSTLVGPSADPYFDSCLSKKRDPATVMARVWIDHAHNDSLDPRCDDFFRACAGATGRAAWLERDVHCRSCQHARRHFCNAIDFRVRVTRFAMMSARNDLVAIDQHRSHRGIWAGATQTFSRFTQRRAHEAFVNVFRHADTNTSCVKLCHISFGRESITCAE